MIVFLYDSNTKTADYVKVFGIFRDGEAESMSAELTPSLRISGSFLLHS